MAVPLQEEWLAAQPIGKLPAVRGVQKRLHRVARQVRMTAVDHRQKVQIVIAERGGEARAQIPGEPQRLQGRRPAVHQIAHAPQAIRLGEAHMREQRPQSRQAALNVANDVGRHRTLARPRGKRFLSMRRQCTAFGASNEKRAMGTSNNSPAALRNS